MVKDRRVIPQPELPCAIIQIQNPFSVSTTVLGYLMIFCTRKAAVS